MGNRIPILSVLLLELMGGAYIYGLQQQHIVGDSIWSIPPTNDFYTNWSSSYSFHIGDTLYFDFDSGLYNVIQVSRGEFDSCSGNQPLNALMDGPAVFPLWRKGVFYFVCNVSDYCWLGLKVSVIVDDEEEEGSRGSPSPSPLMD
ncbi:mavicyanin [Phtheirospermum japonicum]|uniref:Mavicyanin n=1 Tax=Phtheirospermum japonicum TaxID=374723 RepID=A0A830BV61_9LAMI|nr:mavicyanin [Phtheirospermum japonicum]